MKFIEVTSYLSNEKAYINADKVTAVFDMPDYTAVGLVGESEPMFVLEKAKEIMEKINA